MKNLKQSRWIALVLIFAAGCTSTETKVAPQKSTEAEVREFREAQALYRAHKTAQSLKTFLALIQRHPETDLADEAAYNVGQIYFDSGDYFRAARYWLFIVDGKIISRRFDRALLGAASAETQIGHYDDALKLLVRFKMTETTDPNLAAQVFELSSKLKLQKSDSLGALKDLLAADGQLKQPAEKQALINKAAEIINGNMTEKELHSAVGDGSLAQVELPLRFRLAQVEYDQKSWSEARDLFSSVIQKFPTSDEARRSQTYVTALDAQEKTDATTIGAILPLTGKYSQMGYKTLRGIQMGLGLFNKDNASPVKLAIIDSEGNPDVARRGVERLVSEDHVIAIVGDIMSKTAQPVATKAQELGVPCLTLSQKQGLNQIGDFIFRNTLTPEMQMRSLVDVAMDQKNYKRFAVLFPNDSYGTQYASLFWDNVLSKGGEITAAQSYDPNETDFRDVIQRLVGTYYAEEDRGKELQMRLAQWQKDQAKDAEDKGIKLNPRDKPPKDILPPVVDFDAIFIPDGPKAVGQIAAMIVYNDIDKIPLLGTNLWDTPDIVDRGNKFVENSLFVDDYFNGDESPAMKKFTTQFQSEFNYRPDLFEAQGYDAALLLFNTLKADSFSTTRTALRDQLTKIQNLVGSTGALKMSPAREIEKSLIPLTVTNGKIVKLDIGAGAMQ